MLVKTLAAAAVTAIVGAAFSTTAMARSGDAEIDNLIIQLSGGANAGIYAPPQPVVVQVPHDITVDEMQPEPVRALGHTAPDPSQPLDMTGADGTLRGCYAHGGMASQGEDFNYYCNYTAPTVRADGLAPNAPAMLSPEVDTGYQGVSSVEDNVFQDCLGRGGTPVQLTNHNWACAM